MEERGHQLFQKETAHSKDRQLHSHHLLRYPGSGAPGAWLDVQRWNQQDQRETLFPSRQKETRQRRPPQELEAPEPVQTQLEKDSALEFLS